MRLALVLAAFAALQQGEVTAFSSRSQAVSTPRAILRPGTASSPLSSASSSPLFASTSSASSSSVEEKKTLSPKEKRQQDRKAQIRKEGGLFAFNTKYGALNPFAIYYGLMSILLGIPWFFALTTCQILYKITGGRFDRKRRIPVTLNQMWGVGLMRLTRCRPKIVNYNVLADFYKEKRPAMFISNHNSWLDIPFLGYTIGWRNYKLISKKELGKVPILGKAIAVADNIMVDRTNRRSQLLTLKKGIGFLKDENVHLCTYPEGTRTRTGRLQPFKNGAFKMAHKAGAPVIPISIVGADKAMPAHWMFPFRPARGVAQTIVHAPVESKGKTEEELAAAVRAALIEGLPEDQRPLEE